MLAPAAPCRRPSWGGNLRHWPALLEAGTRRLGDEPTHVGVAGIRRPAPYGRRGERRRPSRRPLPLPEHLLRLLAQRLRGTHSFHLPAQYARLDAGRGGVPGRTGGVPGVPRGVPRAARLRQMDGQVGGARGTRRVCARWAHRGRANGLAPKLMESSRSRPHVRTTSPRPFRAAPRTARVSGLSCGSRAVPLCALAAGTPTPGHSSVAIFV
jgi:hypothetical protein